MPRDHRRAGTARVRGGTRPRRPEHPARRAGIQDPSHHDTDTPICVYCGSGGRAALSAQRLQELGYTRVTSIEGGIKGWIGFGLPTETAGGHDEEE